MTRIIGIDPGLARTGYGIIQIDRGKYRHVDHGVICTQPSETTGGRLSVIFKAVTELLEEFGPGEAGIEALFFAKNITSALPVAQAKGVVLLAFSEFGIPCTEYPPQAIKQAIVGRGRAEKSQVQELVRVILGLNSTAIPDHASDALGAAICHYHTMTSRAVIESGRTRTEGGSGNV